jgi:cell wall-associated NlpC family hydrolase
MSIPRYGSVWTWPDPLKAGGDDFTSRAAELWYHWGEEGHEDEQQWFNNFQSYTTGSTWQNAMSEQFFDDSFYAFTTNPYDPFKAVTPYTPRSNFAYAKIMGDIGAWIEREHPELSWFGQTGATVGSASMANLGGEWAEVDKWNDMILRAQTKVNEELGVLVPGNLIKAIMKLESGGVWVDSDPGAGATGVMQVMPFWGTDLGVNLLDPAQNIYAGVKILAMNYKLGEPGVGTPSWEWAARRYLGLGGADAYGTTHQTYWARVSQDWATLDAAVQGNYGGQVGATTATVLAEAQKFVGVPYNWGAIPGRGDNPWETGWDCSGFTYWLDQTYGTGQLPQGSHYQYDYARRTGQLYTNIGQIAPGDILFFDTGNMAGGGAELNRAGHVGVALGDGKMISALNPGADTVISNIQGIGVFLGGMKMGWSGPGGNPGGNPSSFLAITGGTPFPVTQEFGPTEWSQGDGAYMYDDYDYTLGVDGHPGLDVGTPMYTQLYAPADGVVTIDGGTGFYALEGSEFQPYTGQLQILMPNGDQYILGHMYQIDVRVGQTIRAGQPVGLSGTYNGPHVHVEYWQNKPHQFGAFTATDPRLAFSGQFSGQLGQPGMGDPVFRAGADNWAAFMRATATGQPVSGYSSGNSGGSFHNWMKSGMLNGWQSPNNGAQPGTPGWQPGQNTVAGAWGVSFSPQVWSSIQNLNNARRS